MTVQEIEHRSLVKIKEVPTYIKLPEFEVVFDQWMAWTSNEVLGLPCEPCLHPKNPKLVTHLEDEMSVQKVEHRSPIKIKGVPTYIKLPEFEVVFDQWMAWTSNEVPGLLCETCLHLKNPKLITHLEDAMSVQKVEHKSPVKIKGVPTYIKLPKFEVVFHQWMAWTSNEVPGLPSEPCVQPKNPKLITHLEDEMTVQKVQHRSPVKIKRVPTYIKLPKFEVVFHQWMAWTSNEVLGLPSETLLHPKNPKLITHLEDQMSVQKVEHRSPVKIKGVPTYIKSVSYTHLTLPTNREV